MMHETRVPTGIPGLDEILHGGFIPRHTYLIVGSAGSGKTILSLQWLLEGLRRGEKCLYITLAEPESEVKRNVTGFGWNLNGLDLLDLSPSGEPDEFEDGEYQVFTSSEVERIPIWRSSYRAVQEKQPRRMVIDSITQLRYLSTDEYQFRKHILGLVAFLRRRGCTALLTFEPTEMEREASVALAVDGLCRLRHEVSSGRVIGLRSLQVEKLRGSDFMSGLHPLRITGRGILIFPHYIERPDGAQPAQTPFSSSLPQLDELLGGGIESGTTTIISGHSGTGKSSLGMQFLTTAIAAGERAVLYTFEEPVAFILARSRGIGMPVDEALASGSLRIIRVNSMELYPDEFLYLLREAVEQENRRVVMIDSLRGYNLAMEQFGSLTAHLQNLVTYCQRQAVTVFLTSEVEQIIGGLQLTELGISYLFDNVIMLRYAEVDGRLIRVISCLKKRLGHAQSELCELRITQQGLQVGEKLERMRGVLTGTPTREIQP